MNFWLPSRIRRFIIWFVTSYRQRKNTEFSYMDSNLRPLALQFSKIYFIIMLENSTVSLAITICVVLCVACIPNNTRISRSDLSK